jgi:hypothetical protein
MCGVSLFFTIIIIWDSKFKKVEKKILRKHFKFYRKRFICFFLRDQREIQEGMDFITGIAHNCNYLETAMVYWESILTTPTPILFK